jgi:putative hydrolase of the HAD superfamily
MPPNSDHVARGIVWDFDGTLAFRKEMWSGALARVAQRDLGLAATKREAFVPRLQSGFPWHRPEVPHPDIRTGEEWWAALSPLLARTFAAVCGVAEAEAVQLTANVRSEYLDPSMWSVFEDVFDSLDRLAIRGWHHVVLSNHVPELPELAKSLGLSTQFDAVLSSANIGFENLIRRPFIAQ